MSPPVTALYARYCVGGRAAEMTERHKTSHIFLDAAAALVVALSGLVCVSDVSVAMRQNKSYLLHI